MQISKNRLDLLENVLPKCGIVAEVGVSRGDFSMEILHRNRPHKLHLIDIWLRSTDRLPDKFHHDEMGILQERMREEIRVGRVMMHQGWSAELLRIMPRAGFDWIYIDADHSQEAVLHDLSAGAEVVAPYGYLACHDYHMESVQAGVGIFCERENWEVFCVTEYDPAVTEPAITACPSCVLRRK